MRILTWNINGVRTLPQYHPWNTFKTQEFEGILNHLDADIICFQEMKSSRQQLPKAVGIPPSFHSFFSFPQRKSGYSGVAVYAKAASAFPLKAEEGITGLLQPTPPLSASERVSRPDAYPTERPGCEDLDHRALDAEGRALVVDFGLFVLINVYCPNDGTDADERIQYKSDFHALLEARVRGLLEEKREVILLGDLNACAAVIDHAEGKLIVARAQEQGIQDDEGFWLGGARQWLKDLIADESGILVDVVRRFHPDRKGMYTCWNTKISARESNYGTRIDYILVSPGLLPWIKTGDIQPELKGSDHCPVFIELHDFIVDEHGREVHLRDVLGAGTTQEPPRIAAKFWDEYKQRLLSTFFVAKPAPIPSAAIVAPAATPEAPQPPTPSPTLSPVPKRKVETEQPIASSSQPPAKKTKVEKNKQNEKLGGAAAPKKNGTGQTSLASFFAKPSTTKTKGKARETTEVIVLDDDDDADYRLALKLSQESAPPSSSPPKDRNAEAKAWGRLLAPPAPPRCTVHNEPAKAMTVTKTGPNKGKSFFICSRPVGPGYDAGKGNRRRHEVDDQWRCDYFKWASDARKEEMARTAHSSSKELGWVDETT
ncbi:DNA-(apurinic or apyrimidinic site) lyase [Mycena chlorophos]|uniref:DNA-(apurinic or apyrimidinic site) endonuclease n=1 Tax=Mycena chlorophos TaxID=658473 RepID=A0A8H6TPH9_MYCCL|nr:DNA-(apurinic or apyrimidinic site) lyase [Mycena chlorophos]